MPIVFSSHQLELVERVCDRVAMIVDGRIVTEGAIDELRASRARRLVRVEVAGAPDGLVRVDPGGSAGGRGSRRRDPRARRTTSTISACWISLVRSARSGTSAWCGRRWPSSSVRCCRRERRASGDGSRHVAGCRRPGLLGAAPRQGVRDLHDDHAHRPLGLHLAPRVLGRSRVLRARVRGGAARSPTTSRPSPIRAGWRSRSSDSTTTERRRPHCARVGWTRCSRAVVDDVRGGTAILRVLRGAPDLLDQLVQGAAIGLRIDTALSEAGVDDADRPGTQGPASDRLLADPSARSRPGLEGGGRVRGRPVALRAALRLRDLGGHRE